MTTPEPAAGPRVPGPRQRPVGDRTRVPTLRLERSLLRDGHVLVAGMDEVGRGALAGPVSVGVVVVDAATRTAPSGLRDSKLLAPAAREALVPRLRRWGVAWAVGHAGPDEVDAHGIIAALRLAGRRALAALDVVPDVVVLDGSHDWLGDPRPRAAAQGPEAEHQGVLELALPVAPVLPVDATWRVQTCVKADLRCAAVAAASVLAKTERDALMRDLARTEPRYGWEGNKGYSAPEHLAALREHGPCRHHRRTWRLPGLGTAGGPGTGDRAGEDADALPEGGQDQSGARGIMDGVAVRATGADEAGGVRAGAGAVRDARKDP